MKDYILLITLHADPAMPPGYSEWGGTHTYMKELLDEFGQNHIQCILVTRKSMQQLPDVEKFNEYCTIYRITSGDEYLLDKTKLKNYHHAHLAKILEITSIQESLPRIIHSVYWNSGRIAMKISEKLQIPFVHSIISNSKGRVSRGAYEPVPERAKYEQEIFNKASRLICVSEDEAADLVNLYHVPKEKIVVAGQYIHPFFLVPAHDTNGFPRMNSKIGIDIQENIAQTYNNAYQISSDDNYWAYKSFAYIGRMDFNKGLKHILNAWYRLYVRYQEVCPALWLAGGSLAEIEMIRTDTKTLIPDLDQIEKIGKIVWWGCLDPAGLSTILLKSSVLLTHSLYEPGGRVAIEAMSEGVPVIATSNGFAKDAIHDWKEGFLVMYSDVETLSHRMEHFIRQPYLSNALGQNARCKAIEVIGRWDFGKRHLACYDGTEPLAVPAQKKQFNEFKRRRIHLFPHCNMPYSTELLSSFFCKCTGENALSIEVHDTEECTSDIYQIIGKHGNYFIKRTYTRLSLSPLVNPVCSDDYVRHADSAYQIELRAYQRQSQNFLAGHDDLHYLMLLKELQPYQIENPEDLMQCISYLLNRKETIEVDKANLFTQIMSKPMDSANQIQEIIRELQTSLSDYWFEPSGVFSNQLNWKIAPYLLEYNRNSIPHKFIQTLEHAIQIFGNLQPLPICALRDINTDIQLDHIRQNDGNIVLIDLEKTSIGTIETEISSLLFAYFCIERETKQNCWEYITTYLRSISGIKMQEIFSSTAYYFYYECIISAVLNRSVPEHLKNELVKLCSMVQGENSI